MEQLIDIETFKRNPNLFFSQLPEKAEEEFENILNYIIFKYTLKKTFFEKKNITDEFDIYEKKKTILPRQINEFVPLKRKEIYE